MTPALHGRYRGDAFLLVRGASGVRNSAERPVLVFQCYLDDSGTSGLPVVTIAGFISALRHWEHLEPVLDSILARYGVDLLHTKEFHDTKGCFAGWRKIKKRSFAEELFAATRGRLYGLSVTVRKGGFVNFQRQSGQLQEMSPVGVCFSTIMMRIVTDVQIGGSVKENGVAFLVESGNKNNAEIEKLFHKMARQSTFEGCLRSISFIDKGSCRAIQLADFFAFYSRRHMRNHDRFSGKLALPACAYLDIIKSHGPVWQYGGTGTVSRARAHLDDLPSIADLTALARSSAEN